MKPSGSLSARRDELRTARRSMEMLQTRRTRRATTKHTKDKQLLALGAYWRTDARGLSLAEPAERSLSFPNTKNRDCSAGSASSAISARNEPDLIVRATGTGQRGDSRRSRHHEGTKITKATYSYDAAGENAADARGLLLAEPAEPAERSLSSGTAKNRDPSVGSVSSALSARSEPELIARSTRTRQPGPSRRSHHHEGTKVTQGMDPHDSAAGCAADARGLSLVARSLSLRNKEQQDSSAILETGRLGKPAAQHTSPCNGRVTFVPSWWMLLGWDCCAVEAR
jgi:hypothetical protein